MYLPFSTCSARLSGRFARYLTGMMLRQWFSSFISTNVLQIEAEVLKREVASITTPSLRRNVWHNGNGIWSIG